MSRHFIAILALLGFSTANGADPQSVGSAPPAPAPLLVCPPKFSVPLFVPADELLSQASYANIVTPEGYIIQNRPVGDCVNCVKDAETRAYEMVERPLKLREYQTQTRLLQAEIAFWTRRVANYKYFSKGGALMVSYENARLSLLESQERLRNLRYERMLHLRHQDIERQLSQGIPVEASVIVTQ